jgi:hypothetical protein
MKFPSSDVWFERSVIIILNYIIDNVRAIAFRWCETIPVWMSVKIDNVVNNSHWLLVLQFGCRPVNLCVYLCLFDCSMKQLAHVVSVTVLWKHMWVFRKKNNLRVNLYQKQNIILILVAYPCWIYWCVFLVCSVCNMWVFNDIVRSPDHMASDDCEMVKINWKGCGRRWSRSHLKYYPGICLEGLRKAVKYVRMVSALVKISTRHILKASQKCYHLNQLAWLFSSHDREN